MERIHTYHSGITWTGNRGTGTSRYDAYDRNFTVSIENKADIAGSSDIPFRGDGTRHNPEDMLLSSLSSCHMLWYLHLCADAGVIVVSYNDHATGIMQELPEGGGYFTEVTLHPEVTVSESSMTDKANALHKVAGSKCFIANSCRFPVNHEPVCHTANP